MRFRDHPKSADKPHNPLLNSGAIMSAAILLNVVNPEMKISEVSALLAASFDELPAGEREPVR